MVETDHDVIFTIYFSNVYSQESVGNSSDSEFTSLTSLLPSSSGTVFMNYFNRDYETIINDSRSIIQEFLAGRQQRKIMIRNAIIEISMILGIGTFLIFLLNSSMEVNIINALLTTQVGNIILVYLIIFQTCLHYSLALLIMNQINLWSISKMILI